MNANQPNRPPQPGKPSQQNQPKTGNPHQKPIHNPVGPGQQTPPKKGY